MTGVIYYSCNGCFQLKLQADGNVVVYPNDHPTNPTSPMWATGGQNWGGIKTCLNLDGSFVVYNAQGDAIRSLGVFGPNSYAKIQNDGQFVIINAAGTIVFSSNITGSCPTTLGN